MIPVLQSLLTAAATGTGAERGWVLALRDDRLEVVAATGAGTAGLIGTSTGSADGTAGYVVASGQPMALTVRPGDERLSEGVAARLSIEPTSVLCVPCTEDDTIVGAIELIDRVGGGPFSFDDVELLTLLAGIAGVALSTPRADIVVRSPAELGAELAQLATLNPVLYARVAVVVDALLARA